jgi:anti-sigma factor RsiW
MSQRQVTAEMLNAYVDGELDPAGAAEVARAVAADPALAREVAALSRLRSALADSVEAPALSLPERRPSVGRGAFAAGIAAVLLLAGSLLVANLGRQSGADWLAEAWQIHHAWSAGDITAQTRATVLVAHYAEAVPGAHVPDLSASRLSLVHAAVQSLSGGRKALLAGYRGTRGCKISLLVFKSPDTLGEALSPFHEAGAGRAFGWRVGPLGYAMLSDGMDPGRFKLLAESVRRASREGGPFDEKTHIALRKSRDRSPPCTA